MERNFAMITNNVEYQKAQKEFEALLKEKEPLLEIEKQISILNQAIASKRREIAEYLEEQAILNMKQCNHLFVMYHSSYDGSEQTKLCRCVKCGLNNFRKNDGRKEKEMQTIFSHLSLFNANFIPKTYFLTPLEVEQYASLAMQQKPEITDEEIKTIIKQKEEEKRVAMQHISPTKKRLLMNE